MSTLRRSLTLALVTAAVLPAASSAATVSLSGGQVRFTADNGERNSPIFTSTDADIVVDDQSGKELRAGSGCVLQQPQDAPANVHCSRTGVTRLVAELGDLDDRVTFYVQLPATVSGGTGVDTVTAQGLNSLDDVQNDGAGGQDNIGSDVERLVNAFASTDDNFTGSDANNRLESPGGIDVMNGAGGDDYINTRDTSFDPNQQFPPDQITCGPGNDVADADDEDVVAPDCEIVIRESGEVRLTDAADTFRAPRPGLTIFGLAGSDTIDAGGAKAVAGGAGNDRITLGSALDITARGDDGNDRIYGLVGRDRIIGGNGNDKLYGERSNDRIDGGPGRDGIDAGQGDDLIRVRDGEADRVHCSSGRDKVVADRKDRVERDCEKVYRR